MCSVFSAFESAVLHEEESLTSYAKMQEEFGQFPHNHRYYRQHTQLCQGLLCTRMQEKTYRCTDAGDWKLKEGENGKVTLGKVSKRGIL